MAGGENFSGAHKTATSGHEMRNRQHGEGEGNKAKLTAGNSRSETARGRRFTADGGRRSSVLRRASVAASESRAGEKLERG